jgi:ATP-dependent DNA helicase DinG
MESGAAGSAFGRIHGTNGFEEKRARRFKSGPLPAWCESARGAGPGLPAKSLQKTLRFAQGACSGDGAASAGTLATQVLSVLGLLRGPAGQPGGHLGADAGRAAGRLRRRSRAGSSGMMKAGRPDDYLVCASPISGSDKLRKLLWNRASGAVVMSATLTSCGTFDLFLRQSGSRLLREPRRSCRSSRPSTSAARHASIVPAMRAEPTAPRSSTRRRSAPGCQPSWTRWGPWCCSPRHARCGMSMPSPAGGPQADHAWCRARCPRARCWRGTVRPIDRAR